MDRDRLSRIGHTGLDVMSPVPAAALDRLLDLAGLAPGDRAVDIGAGKGAVARLAAKRGARVTLVERSPTFAALARETLAADGLAALADVYEGDARAFLGGARRPHPGEDPAPSKPEQGAFRLAICSGASHALGGRDAALSALAQAVSPGGHVLFGEGYWRRRPSPDYLAVLGASEEDFGTLDDTVAAARARGLSELAVETAEGDRFDHYERSWCAALARFADDHPEDPDAGELRAVAAARLAAYEKWGREQLGFAVHLFVRG